MRSNPSPPEKSVLWIDAFITYRDPTNRHLLIALPRLQAAGWQVKVWCLRSDAPRDSVEHTIVGPPEFLGRFSLLYFSLAMNLYGFWRWLRRAPRPAQIVHATCGTYLPSDIATVHFLNCVWLRKQLELGFGSGKEFAQFCLHAVGAFFERLHWWSPWLRKILPVSDSVGEEIRRRARPGVPIETLPNSYDESRFNPEVREKGRAPMRQQLGFAPSEVVFAFVSLGHHKRKGFWLAIDALAELHADPAMAHVKFLVIGGTPATLADLQREVARRAPGWERWLIFAGQQTRVEDYLAAADALLYPSYFEAFCLSEIEAAAMGLPLLLTRHHGSEMILEDGVNGLWLEYDPHAIAAAIRRFLAMGPGAFRRSVGAALTRSQYAERLLGIYERISSKSVA